MKRKDKNGDDGAIGFSNLYRLLEHSIAAGGWTYQATGRHFTWSDGMYQLFGLTAGDEQSIILSKKIVHHINTDGEPFERTISIEINGLVKVLKLKAEPFLDGDGLPAGMTGVAVDISAQHDGADLINSIKNELALKQRQLSYATDELKTFNTVAAGDFKDTLQKLYTILEFLVSNEARNFTDSGKANVRRAQAAIQKMKLLTEDIIAFSSIKLQPGTVSEVNLNVLLKDAEKDIKDKYSGVDVHVQCDHFPAIAGNASLLLLLFHHLFDNAVKFRSGKDSISVKVKCAEVHGRHINHAEASPDTLYSLVSVKDDGIGFDPALKDKIFGMFFRAPEAKQFRGSGTGLAICRKIMEVHGGFITADAEEKGSRIDCYFPTGR